MVIGSLLSHSYFVISHFPLNCIDHKKDHSHVLATFPYPTLAVVTLGALPAVGQDLNDLQEKATKAAIAKVAPSVVQIETSGGTELISTGPPASRSAKASGRPPGWSLPPTATSFPRLNFANKPTAIFVTVPGHKERYVAKIVSTDQTRMLTLLKIETTALTVPAAVAKKEMRVGQLGTGPGTSADRPEDRGLSQPPSVSVGILSALNRIWGKAIQTDAKVSPANYGGPLVDISGRVQGVLFRLSPCRWRDGRLGMVRFRHRFRHSAGRY